MERPLWTDSLMLITTIMVGGCGGGGSPEHAPLEAGAARALLTPAVETFEDLDADGDWDPNEPFDDIDGDGAWSPVWIAGFGSDRYATGIHDDLFARVLVLQRAEVRIGIVSVDWVGVMLDDLEALHALAQQAGLDLDHLIVSSTHNHEGPDTLGLWGRPAHAESGLDPDYLQLSFERIVAALGEATAGLAPVRLTAGLGKTEGLTHDSRLPEVKHEVVTALRFDRTDGTGPVALVVHWSNHPESLGGRNQLLTADFPASLVAGLEEAAQGAVGIYWQGMLGGLMNPLHVDLTDAAGNPLPGNSFEKAERLGQLVAEEALAALERGEDVTGDGRLAFRHREILAPFENDELLLANMIGLMNRKLYREDGTPQPPNETLSQPSWAMSTATVMDLGQVQIVTVPGELYPELAVLNADGRPMTQDPQDPAADFFGTACETPIYAHMRDTPYKIVLGLANDEIGYIIPKCQWDTDAPYTYGDDDAPYGETNSAGPQTAGILIRALADELAALQAEDQGS